MNFMGDLSMKEFADKYHAGQETAVYRNSKYQVVKRVIKANNKGCDLIHLSIKRLDKEPIHDWRDLQEIKNEIVGRYNEGMELYPAESRRVDTANQYHLWVFADPKYRIPIGFDTRLVTGVKEAESIGAKQRKFK
jgi:hypothetical protein